MIEEVYCVAWINPNGDLCGELCVTSDTRDTLLQQLEEDDIPTIVWTVYGTEFDISQEDLT